MAPEAISSAAPAIPKYQDRRGSDAPLVLPTTLITRSPAPGFNGVGNKMVIASTTMAWPRQGGLGLVELGQLGGGEGEVGGLGGVGDGLGAAGAGDRDDHRGLGQHPGQGNLLGRNPVRVGDLLERGVPGPELSGAGDAAERAVGQEG